MFLPLRVSDKAAWISSCFFTMGKFKDLTGQAFGRLTVKEYLYTKNGHSFWVCKCECGNEKITRTNYLNTGRIKSCGCWRREFKRFEPNYHGEKDTRLYGIWKHMKERCDTKNCKEYKWYGERGICYTPEWKEWKNFRDWGKVNGYDDKLTLDRINNDGNYEPSNCRFVTMKVQANNSRWNRIIEYKSDKKTLSQWGDSIGVRPSTIGQRIDKLGWSIEKALTTPVKSRK